MMNIAAEGLITYAIERQIGFENHQKRWDPVQPETRNGWIRNILQGMAEMDETEGSTNLPDELDRRLTLVQECFAVEPASLPLQRETIRGLRKYINALEQRERDPRPQIQQVAKLLVDMSVWPGWNRKSNGVLSASEQAWDALPRLTEMQPIRFTRVLIGGDLGPGGVEYVSGAITTPEEAARTELFAELRTNHPEVENWPSICTIYICGQDPVRDATEFDLEIIRDEGGRFHKRAGVRLVSSKEMKICSSQMTVMRPESKTLCVVKVEPGDIPYKKEIDHTLNSFQHEVNGRVQPIYLGGGITLCCNEEGKLNSMEPNRRIGDDIICGPFFLVGEGAEGNYVSLSDRQVQLCMEHFTKPELFTGEEPELEPRIEFQTF